MSLNQSMKTVNPLKGNRKTEEAFILASQNWAKQKRPLSFNASPKSSHSGLGASYYGSVASVGSFASTATESSCGPWTPKNASRVFDVDIYFSDTDEEDCDVLYFSPKPKQTRPQQRQRVEKAEQRVAPSEKSKWPVLRIDTKVAREGSPNDENRVPICGLQKSPTPWSSS